MSPKHARLLELSAPLVMVLYVALADKLFCDYDCQHGESFAKIDGPYLYTNALVWLITGAMTLRQGRLITAFTSLHNGVLAASAIFALLACLSAMQSPVGGVLGILWLVMAMRGMRRCDMSVARYVVTSVSLGFIMSLMIGAGGSWVAATPGRVLEKPTRGNIAAATVMYRIGMISLDHLVFRHEEAMNAETARQVGAVYTKITGKDICTAHVHESCE